MDQENFRALFGTLSNSSCLSIVQLLRKNPHSVGEMADALGFEQSRVSHAVARLSGAGIVEGHWAGHRKLYSLHARVWSLLESIDRFLQEHPPAEDHLSSPNHSDDSTPRWIAASAGQNS